MTARIGDNLQISLANADWLLPSDVAMVTLAVRLSGLIDSMIYAGETKDLAQLIARFNATLVHLRLTPDARDSVKIEMVEDDGVGEIIGGALRLIYATDSVDTAGGSKSRSKR